MSSLRGAPRHPASGNRLPSRLRPLLVFVPRLRHVPVTLSFLIALGAVAWVLHALPSAQVHTFRARWSTDLYHLEHNPISALLGSIFICGNENFPLTATEVWLICAPVEQIAGARRMLVLFFVAHPIAALTTEFGGALLHATGHLQHLALHRVDVGPSYGQFGVAAGLCFLLPSGMFRRVGYGGFAAVLLAQWFARPDVTSTGHLLAFISGAILARPVLGALRKQLAATARSPSGCE